MRAVWRHVQFVRNAHWWGNLFSPWKSLQVNYEDFWEPKYGDRLVHSINGFAFGALVSTFFHSLGPYKIIKTIRYTRGWPGYLDWQIHEIIKGQTFMAAFLAFYHAHQLTLKEIRYYRVVSISKIPVPNLRLFYHGLFFAVNLLILRLLSNSVQLIMHSVEQEPQKFLRVLLASAWKLSGNSADLRLEVAWSDDSSFIFSGFS